MGLQDLIVTPCYLIIFYLIAYQVRKRISDRKNSKYLIPAITIKFFGAISLGLVYQFYYLGGDTFNFWTHGSAHLYQAFLDSPIDGLSMIFGDIRDPEYFQYFSQIWLRRADSNLFIIKLTAFFDLFTFHTYSATALIFALFCLGGSWATFESLTRLFPDRRRAIFIAIFTIPSVIFWGSGIMKDTITLGALMWTVSCLIKWIEIKEYKFSDVLIFVLSIYLIYTIKIYVLICFTPAVFAWIYLKNISKIKSTTLKVLIAPLLFTLFLSMGYFSAQLIGAESARYSLESIPEWSRITAYDIGYWTGKDAGSGYSLGELDGTWSNMIGHTPAAINVSLFRPYLWEVNNGLMLLSALESLLFMIIVIKLIFTHFKSFISSFTRPITAFFLIYTLTFAFAVGVSTFNFGTLARYRVPMLPFFGIVLVLGYPQSKIKKNQKYA